MGTISAYYSTYSRAPFRPVRINPRSLSDDETATATHSNIPPPRSCLPLSSRSGLASVIFLGVFQVVERPYSCLMPVVPFNRYDKRFFIEPN